MEADARFLAVTRTIRGEACSTPIDDPDAKLLWRGALPGASIYDRAAHTLRALQAGGGAAIDLLPVVLPASWMVNAKATSHAMQRWLAPAAEERDVAHESAAPAVSRLP